MVSHEYSYENIFTVNASVGSSLSADLPRVLVTALLNQIILSIDVINGLENL